MEVEIACIHSEESNEEPLGLLAISHQSINN
jgi:hypothetical protein